MRFLRSFSACTILLASSASFAQTPTVAARAAVPPLAKADANSPEQVGRNALYQYLDGIAAQDETERREAIAKIVTRQQAELRQGEVRRKLIELMGGGVEKTPLNPRITGSTQMDGFRIEKVLYDSHPNFPVTALLYLPDAQTGPQGLKPGGSRGVGGTAEAVPLSKADAAASPATNPGPSAAGPPTNGAARFPAIVMAPGHGASGKAGDFALASTFARNGFAVLSYDPIGQGERLQYPDPERPGQSLATRPTGEHGEAGLQPTLIGDAAARYFLRDGMAAVDYLLTRPEIDPERIGAFGCSGGGAMTALLGALDSRVHAIGTACYITSMDTLLPSIGPQDAEQSTPGFIAAGLDFPDWVELAAPRPYAIIGTVGDMFPWAGLLASAREARRFYALFDPAAEGIATGAPLPPTPTGPTLNPDTPNRIAANAPLKVIAGIGGHGNLRPLTSEIVSFFLVNLAHSDAQPIVPPAPPPGSSPFAATSVPAGALQVTPTGQVLTSYPGSATVHTLNLARAAVKIPQFVHPQTLQQVQTDVREVTEADAVPGNSTPVPPSTTVRPYTGSMPKFFHQYLQLPVGGGISLNAELTIPQGSGPWAVRLVVVSDLGAVPQTEHAAFEIPGTVVLAVTPRPSPPGGEETKSPILGPFYLTELRAELVGKTLLGMRVDDVIHAIDYLATRKDVDPNNITAQASGHMGLVLLHAAVLDPRLKHITIDHVLESYHSLLEAPMPLDAPQDILPGVLLHYDIPDLVRVLGPRVTATGWLPGTADLAAK
jgi:cephalosporin-C deacetylase-like acetyl esterase